MNNYLIDTHFHLDINDDIDGIISRAKENGIKKFIISGCDYKSIEDGIKIINNYDDIYLTIGLHPDSIDEYNDETISYFENLILSNKKIIGIGEIGLDYFHNKENKDNQKELFTKQLELASKLSLPVVIHSRDAFQDTYDILEKFDLKVTIHCFSGNLENAKKYISRGYLLGIGGVSTFTNSNLKETLKHVPLENLVFETDSPYLAPVPLRGQVNEPKNIEIICKNLANIKNIDKNIIIDITTNNVIKQYNLKINA